MSGSFMQSIAQSWLVLTLTHSGTALGITAALQYVPLLLLSPWGGILADRLQKRHVLYVTQIVQALLALILGLLVLTGVVQLWMVFILAFLLGCTSMVDNPTRQAFIFEMVSSKEIRNAVTLHATLNNFCRIAGPALAGILIATVGLAPCFLFNAFSFGALIVALWMMRTEELHRSPIAPYSSGWRLLREGMQYVFATPELRDAVLMVAIVGTLTYEFPVSLALIAEEHFHSGSSGYATLTTMMGIGAVIGGLLSAGQKELSSRLLITASLFFGIAVLLASVMPSFTLTAVLMLAVGLFSLRFTTLSNGMLQLKSAPQMRGRVMSLWTVTYLGSTAIGGPIVGWTGEFLGPRYGLALGGVAALLASILGARLLRGRKVSVAAVGYAMTAAEARAEDDMRIP